MRVFFAAAISIAIIASGVRADDPPANVKAYLDSIKLTPAQAKEERAEQVAVGKAKIEFLSKKLGEARRAGDSDEVKKLTADIKTARKAASELARAPLHKLSIKGKRLNLPPKVGDIGTLNTYPDRKFFAGGEWQVAKVVSVVDEKNAIVRVGDGDADDPLLWLEVESTAEYTDDLELLSLSAVECVGTKAYTSAIGAKITVPHVRAIDLSKWLK